MPATRGLTRDGRPERARMAPQLLLYIEVRRAAPLTQADKRAARREPAADLGGELTTRRVGLRPTFALIQPRRPERARSPPLHPVTTRVKPGLDLSRPERARCHYQACSLLDLLGGSAGAFWRNVQKGPARREPAPPPPSVGFTFPLIRKVVKIGVESGQPGTRPKP